MGGERPNEVASAAEDPISEHGNHVSDAARVKAVCWRGSPDPLQRPRSARLLGEGLAGSFKRSRSIRGCSHRLGRRNNPQQGSSSRLCRVHPALVQSGRSGGAAAPPEHTEWYGRCWRAEKSCTSREAACAPLLLSRAVAASLCASSVTRNSKLARSGLQAEITGLQRMDHWTPVRNHWTPGRNCRVLTVEHGHL